MARASGTERARRSSLGTPSVSPALTGGYLLVEARSGPVCPGETMVGVDAVRCDAQALERGAERSCLSVEQRA